MSDDDWAKLSNEPLEKETSSSWLNATVHNTSPCTSSEHSFYQDPTETELPPDLVEVEPSNFDSGSQPHQQPLDQHAGSYVEQLSPVYHELSTNTSPVVPNSNALQLNSPPVPQMPSWSMYWTQNQPFTYIPPLQINQQPTSYIDVHHTPCQITPQAPFSMSHHLQSPQSAPANYFPNYQLQQRPKRLSLDWNAGMTSRDTQLLDHYINEEQRSSTTQIYQSSEKKSSLQHTQSLPATLYILMSHSAPVSSHQQYGFFKPRPSVDVIRPLQFQEFAEQTFQISSASPTKTTRPYCKTAVKLKTLKRESTEDEQRPGPSTSRGPGRPIGQSRKRVREVTPKIDTSNFTQEELEDYEKDQVAKKRLKACEASRKCHNNKLEQIKVLEEEVKYQKQLGVYLEARQQFLNQEIKSMEDSLQQHDPCVFGGFRS